MNETKENKKYKSIGEVAKILNLVNKKKDLFLPTPYVFGKKNLNKLNLRFFLLIEDIMMNSVLIF